MHVHRQFVPAIFVYQLTVGRVPVSDFHVIVEAIVVIFDLHAPDAKKDDYTVKTVTINDNNNNNDNDSKSYMYMVNHNEGGDEYAGRGEFENS